MCHVALFRVAGVVALRDMRCTFFVASAALWTCPASFFVVGAAFQTFRVACFLQIALAGLRAVVTTCKFPANCGILIWPRPRTKHRF